MKQFKETVTNYKTIVNDKKLIIEIPISTLVNAFNGLPDGEGKVKKGKRIDFAEFIAEHLHDEIDQNTGASYITNMCDKIFEDINEGFLDASELVGYPVT